MNQCCYKAKCSVSFSFFRFFVFGTMIGPDHLREVFYRMGFTDRDIVALSGGHTLVSDSFTH